MIEKKSIEEIYREVIIPYFHNVMNPGEKFWDIRPPVKEYDILNHRMCGKDCWEEDKVIDLQTSFVLDQNNIEEVLSRTMCLAGCGDENKFWDIRPLDKKL